MKRLATVFGLSVLLAGCSAGVVRPDGPTAHSRHTLSADNQVSAVSVTLSDAAKKKVADNLTFKPDELQAHVKRALEANSLLNADGDTIRRALEVQVTDIRVRSNFSAVMWGFMAGSDSIKGDIVIRAPGGEEVDRFTVTTSYALGGLAGGQDSARMGWLYEEFAKQTVNELRGKNGQKLAKK